MAKYRSIHYILLKALLAVLLTTVMSACSDDEQFTADRNAVLSFSQDTLSFDTIFTGITSTTERVLVYNHNSKGLHIANVRLESGGTSGFMINVDGQNGTSINDVQVLKRDSIFLFVKVNLPANSSMAPMQSSLPSKAVWSKRWCSKPLDRTSAP